MTSHHFERTVRQSVLDRLIDDGRPEPKTWDDSVAAFKGSVMRDLRWLLNTRRVFPPAPAALDLVQSSIYAFGIRDLSSQSADSLKTRSELLREIREAIVAFEPRLAKVSVTLLPVTAGSGRIQFHIEAELRTEPSPEAVVFETTLQASTKAIAVTEAHDA